MRYQQRKKIKIILHKIGLWKVGNYVAGIKKYFQGLYIVQSSKKRLKNKYDKRYIKIKELKDSYEGERCFIVCTGPSLTAEDVSKLINDVTFSMNSIVQIYNKTLWRPTFYSIIDCLVYDKLKELIDFSVYKYVFIRDKLCRDFNIKGGNIIKFPYLPSYLKNKKKSEVQFSDNPYVIVHDGYTVTFALIQIAIYMGFKKIYLIGCDCNYSGEKSHFVDYGVEIVDNPENDMITAYKVAKEYADEHGIKIYNATRGGKLEVFERVDFDSLFENTGDRP